MTDMSSRYEVSPASALESTGRLTALWEIDIQFWSVYLVRNTRIAGKRVYTDLEKERQEVLFRSRRGIPGLTGSTPIPADWGCHSINWERNVGGTPHACSYYTRTASVAHLQPYIMRSEGPVLGTSQ